MSAKHKRPFYVFAAVAAICCVVLVSGIRGSKADDGSQLISTPPAAGVHAPIAPPSDQTGPISRYAGFEGPLGIAGGPGGDPNFVVGDPSDIEISDVGSVGDDPLSWIVSGALEPQMLPPDLGLPPVVVDPDDPGLSTVEDEVKGSGETLRGPQGDDNKDKDKDEPGDQPGDGTGAGDGSGDGAGDGSGGGSGDGSGDGSGGGSGGEETETNVDPLSEDEPLEGGGQGEGGDDGGNPDPGDGGEQQPADAG